MKRKGLRSLLVFTMVITMVLLSACGGTAGTTGVKAAKKLDFPKKPVSMIVHYAAGGGTDLTARAWASAAEKHLGQPVVVVNKPGGGGSVGLMEGANAKADGYTVTMATVVLVTLPHLGLSPVTYQDFKPVAMANADPSSIIVRADSKWKTMKEFLEYAKSRPGELKLGNAGTGGIWHLEAVTFEKGTGTKFNQIPFDGAGPALTALLGGHVDVVSASPNEAKAQVEAGKVRILAVNDVKRMEAFPDVPTLKDATGLDTKFVGTIRGVAVPKDTPDEIVTVLQDAFMKGAQDPAFVDFMKKNALGIMVKDGKGFGEALKESHDKFGKLIPELGLSKK
jgi:tripartite-type tricarboxylate transporter receptor subunit TctC